MLCINTQVKIVQNLVSYGFLVCGVHAHDNCIDFLKDNLSSHRDLASEAGK